YVTLSWFFRAVLGLDAHERQAMRMADLVSPVVADRLAETLASTEEIREGTETVPSDGE
ncbi:metal-dependent transcriptional regulator, partial [Halorubrum sp. AD140]|nr:metal-dependent transcriptional regulator [Halorubrum sp. AD140]